MLFEREGLDKLVKTQGAKKCATVEMDYGAIFLILT